MSSIKGPHNRGRHEAIEGQIPTQNDLSTLTSIREQLSQYKTETKSTKEELRVQKKILQYTVDQIVNLRQAQEQLKSKRVAKGEGGAEPESWLLLKPTDENTSETVDTLLDISELRARKIELQKYCQSYHRQLHRLREERRELHLEVHYCSLSTTTTS
jgi:chromosome segregation ATPase